ncbi:Bromodomain-containing protein [Suillus hirtellus]|nr:Bromodomain-containing protein [Suillus hirtellus]
MNATEHSATNTEQRSILSIAVNGDNVVNDLKLDQMTSDSNNPSLKSEIIDTLSTCVEISTPLDPASIPIHPPSGTPRPMEGQLLDDVKMAEQTIVDDLDEVPTTNGVHTADADGDVHMEQSPPTTNGHSNGTLSHFSPAPVDSAGPPTSRATSNFDSPQQRSDAVDDDEVKPPPAKRARKYSDADQASIANTGSPPPITASSVQTNGDTVVSSPIPTSTPTGNGISTLSPVQHRFCLSTIRSLKKLKDASAFVHPVDPVALNIPHYPTIIKTPMDLSTIERKLMSSNPAKPETNPNIPRYYSAEEFVSDVRLVFSNCITFNGPDHVIAQAGKHVEAVFDKQIKQLPPPAEPKPPIVKKVATPPPPPPPAPPKKAAAAPVRRPSTSVPVIRRNEAEQASARPKREIHPPPPKDLPYADVPKKMRKVKVPKDDGTGEQLKYCGRILSDLQRKQHQTIAAPFYEPVDAVKLDIPTYYRVIKKPMDMSTMRKKLEAGEYPNASKFFDDFKLMIRNCFLFNPAGTPVNQAGIELQRLFDEKWKNLPPLRDASDDEEEEEEDEESEEERNRRIANIEAQIESMRGNLMALKAKPAKEKKKKEKKEKAPVASTSKAAASRAPKTAPATNGNKRKTTTKKPMAEDDALSFEQKKDLSEAITSLDGVKLEKVIQIIHEGVPEIRDSTEEIELEIDILPPHVLTKLYNFVLRPLRQPTQKRNRTGKGTGTGGLKRKSMDETAEAEKIRKLEERMRLFDDNNFATPNATPALAHQNDSDHSSDSSSDDSSGSESE